MRPFHCLALTPLALLLLGTTAIAGTPAVTGLGQAWPNAPDVSSSPRFHAYRFEKQGVSYVQINDRSGTVRGAVAYIAGQVLELPIGVDASRWNIADVPAASSPGETVYQDDGVTVHAAPQADGTMLLMLAPTDCNAHPENCGNKGP